ncbi:hypothetical protein J1N35_041456 [Gossypium stocksii]|uniref:Uncharacterized protein n=1 Tax=Gossypium stocksii TaxID=47602 RepID=A0A9D3UHD9_9ROSI|nr:hypothetical protein J1N35_041456 [Gossypium stocksii]
MIEMHAGAKLIGQRPRGDYAFYLCPSQDYIIWYMACWKPFLFRGQRMLVPPHMERLRHPSHHLPQVPPAPEPKPAPELKPKLDPIQDQSYSHSGGSPYDPDLGAIIIFRAHQATHIKKHSPL